MWAPVLISPSEVGNEVVGHHGFHLFTRVGRNQTKGLASRSLSATTARWGILDNKAASGIDTRALRAEQVRVGPVGIQYVDLYPPDRSGTATYSGLPFSTSSETTKTSGIGTPTAVSAEVAYTIVAEVQIAHLGVGSLWCGPSCCHGACRSAVITWIGNVEMRIARTFCMISRTPGRAMIPWRPFFVDSEMIASSKRLASAWRAGIEDGE